MELSTFSSDGFSEAGVEGEFSEWGWTGGLGGVAAGVVRFIRKDLARGGSRLVLLGQE